MRSDGGEGGHRRRGALVVVAMALLPAALPAAFGGAVRGAIVGAGALEDSRIEGERFPRRIIDPAGAVHRLERPPARIVSTFLASDETLAALVDLRRVVGVSRYVDAPETSNAVGLYPPTVARVRAEAEQIVALRPDIVFVTSFTDASAVKLLQGAGIPLLRFARFASMEDVLANVSLVGAAVGAEAEAAALVAAARRRMAAVAARVAGRPRARVLFYDAPTYTVGADTLIADMIARAGGINAASELGLRGPVKVGLETVLALDPEVIVIPRYAENVDSLQALTRNPAWAALTAVRANRVHHIPASSLSVVSHHAVSGLEQLARMLHPDVSPAPGR